MIKPLLPITIDVADTYVNDYRQLPSANTQVVYYDAQDLLDYLQQSFEYIKNQQQVPEDYNLAVGFYPSLKDNKLDFIIAPAFVAKEEDKEPQVLDCFNDAHKSIFNRNLELNGKPAFAFDEGGMFP